MTRSDGGTFPTDQPPPNSVLAEIMGLDGLANVPRPKPLIEGILSFNSLAWIAGPPGSYKTFLALDYGLHVATGTTYMGRTVTQAPTLYVAGEGLSGLYDRVMAWQQASQQTVVNTYWLPRAIPVTSVDWVALCDAARTIGAGMVILDTQARMAGSLDENSVAEMNTYITGLDALKQATGACVVSIHHSSKNGAALRGSTAVQGAADTVVTVEVKDKTIGVDNLKQKDIALFQPYWVRPAEHGASCVLIECDKPTDWDLAPARKAYGAKNSTNT